MKLMDVYLKMSASGVEKTAAAAGVDEVDALIASLGLKGEVKTAEDREVVKKAAAYIEMGTQIARETFVTEVLGNPVEKVAAVMEETPAKPATEEKPAATEKTAAAVVVAATDDLTEKLLADLGLIEKKAAPAPVVPAVDAEKLAAELKEGALRELVSHHLVPSARAGNEKAMGALKKIASAPKGKEIIEEAVKNAAAAQEKSKGGLAKFLKSRNEKK